MAGMRGVINLGAPTGDVGPGDEVICRGDLARVVKVKTVPPGPHAPMPVRDDLTAVVVETTKGTRYLGASHAWIGGDLRMHWYRGEPPTFPRTVDGVTVWACCVSTIGPVCQHRRGSDD